LNKEQPIAEIPHLKMLQEAGHIINLHQMIDYQLPEIRREVEKEYLAIQEIVRLMEEFPVTPAYNAQLTILVANVLLDIPIAVSHQIIQRLNVRQADHLAVVPVLTEHQEVPTVVNHQEIPVCSDHLADLPLAQTFNDLVEIPIVDNHPEAQVFSDHQEGQPVMLMFRDLQAILVQADRPATPVQDNQAIQTVEEDIDLPLFLIDISLTLLSQPMCH
jgi:hypothetical protein